MSWFSWLIYCIDQVFCSSFVLYCACLVHSIMFCLSLNRVQYDVYDALKHYLGNAQIHALKTGRVSPRDQVSNVRCHLFIWLVIRDFSVICHFFFDYKQSLTSEDDGQHRPGHLSEAAPPHRSHSSSLQRRSECCEATERPAPRPGPRAARQQPDQHLARRGRPHPGAHRPRERQVPAQVSVDNVAGERRLRRQWDSLYNF
mgnify:CR=1 FL=1